jgi:ABC-type multidrug transport system ATPase subunit
VEATAGSVHIYGRSLAGDLQAIRQMTGVCPQYNVLFLCLTVHEHLLFFGKIKGLYGHRLHDSVDRVINEVIY